MGVAGELANQDPEAAAGRLETIHQQIQKLARERELFATVFMPGRQEYGDRLDWELRAALDRHDCITASARREP